jgi:hypothetical protein
MAHPAHRNGYPDGTAVIGCLCGLSHRTSDRGNEEKAKKEEVTHMQKHTLCYSSLGAAEVGATEILHLFETDGPIRVIIANTHSGMTMACFSTQRIAFHLRNKIC